MQVRGSWQRFLQREQGPRQANLEQVKEIIDVIKESQATTEITSSIRYIKRKKTSYRTRVQYAILCEGKSGDVLVCAQIFLGGWGKMGTGEERQIFSLLTHPASLEFNLMEN